MNQRSYQGLSHCPVQFPSWSDWERHSLQPTVELSQIEQLALGAYPGPCGMRYCQLPPLPRGQSPTGSATCQAQDDQPGLLTFPRAGVFSFRNHGVPPCGSGWSAVTSTPGAAAPYMGSPRAHDWGGVLLTSSHCKGRWASLQAAAPVGVPACSLQATLAPRKRQLCLQQAWGEGTWDGGR